MSNIVKTLRERGLLSDLTDPAFEQACEKKSFSVYIGFDPTAESLHIGSMVQIMVLKHFQMAGHRPIAVVGGGTGMVGDPSGRSSERNLLDAAQLAKNLEGIRRNLSQFIDFEGDNAAKIVNNADWLAKLGFLEVLRDVGKYFRISDMLAKDSVKSRLNSESGMSFTEFSYMILQAYDFKYLYEHYSCEVQAGGSDQWGNITAGTELIRRTLGGQGYGVTTSLLLNSEGEKMGKTAAGAVWLSAEKLSPYEYYQFWIRQEDGDVERFLKMLTLLPLEEISHIVAEHWKDPAWRVGQKALAFEITSMTHGRAEAEKAKQASEALFSGPLAAKTDVQLRALFAEVPSVELKRADLDAGFPLADLLVQCGLVASKGEAKRLMEQRGVYLNNANEPLAVDKRTITAADLASESMLILRAGKKKYCLARFA
ncbi:tyrosine--tRNA ligase [soil metagenome]